MVDSERVFTLERQATRAGSGVREERRFFLGVEERICPRCGAALKEGVRFCTSCGERIAPTVAVGEIPREEEEAPKAGATCPGWRGEAGLLPSFPQDAAVESFAALQQPCAAPAKMSGRVPLVLGITGGLLLLAGAAILVLYLSLWRADMGGTGNPVSLARKYMESLENEDVDSFLSCFEEDYFPLEDYHIMEGMDLDLRKMVEMAFSFMDVSFEQVELELQREEGDEATVITSGGRLTISLMGMEEEVNLADDPMEFTMIRKGGRWYLTEDPLPTFGSDTDFDANDRGTDLEDFDLEDLEDYLPEGWSPGNMDLEDMEELIRELMEEMEKLPGPEAPSDEMVTRSVRKLAGGADA